MSTLPAPGYISDNARNEGEAKLAFESMIAAAKEMPGGSARTALSIVNGAIVPTAAAHTVDTENDIAADDLDSISTANHPDGRILILSCESAARPVTVRHNQGGSPKIFTHTGANIVLTDPGTYLMLMRVGNDWQTLLQGLTLESNIWKLSQIFRKSISVSQDNESGGGIIMADDGDMVDLNNGYLAMRFSNGVAIHAGNKSGGVVILLRNNGHIDAARFNGGSEGLTGTAPINIGGRAAVASNADNATNAGYANTAGTTSRHLPVFSTTIGPANSTRTVITSAGAIGTSKWFARIFARLTTAVSDQPAGTKFQVCDQAFNDVTGNIFGAWTGQDANGEIAVYVASSYQHVTNKAVNALIGLNNTNSVLDIDIFRMD